MNRKLLLSVLLFITAINAQNTYLSIYSRNFSVITEERTIALKKGNQSFLLENLPHGIDPASIHIAWKGRNPPALLELNLFPNTLNASAMFSHFRNQSISVQLKGNREYKGRLIRKSPDGLFLELSDGTIKLISPSDILEYTFPGIPDEILLKPELKAQVQSPEKGEFTYFLNYLCRDISWSAEYALSMNSDEETGILESGIWLENNTDKTFRNAVIRIISGEVSGIKNSQPSYLRKNTRGAFATEAYSAPEVPQPPEVEKISAYYAYTFPGNYRLKSEEKKRLLLFKPMDITFAQVFRFRSRGRPTSAPVYQNLDFILRLVNDEESGLGKSFPQGTIRVYKGNGEEPVSLTGEAEFPYLSVNDTLELYLGKAFDIKGSRIVRNIERNSSRKIEKGDVEIKLVNRSDKAAGIEVLENIRNSTTIMRSSHTFRKINNNLIKFSLEVPAKSEEKITYGYIIKW